MPPALRDLIAAACRARSSDPSHATATEDDVDALLGGGLLAEPEHVPTHRQSTLAPLEYITVSHNARPLPAHTKVDRLWMAEHRTDRVSKEGLEFNRSIWWHPAMIAFTTGAAGGPRPMFIVLYDASAYARGALQSITVYQELATGERMFLCEAVRKDQALETLNVGEYCQLADEYFASLRAKRALSEDEYVRITRGIHAAEALVKARARRDRDRAAQREPARAARPIDASQATETRRRREREDALGDAIGEEPTPERPARSGGRGSRRPSASPPSDDGERNATSARPTRGKRGLLSLLGDAESPASPDASDR